MLSNAVCLWPAILSNYSTMNWFDSNFEYSNILNSTSADMLGWSFDEKGKVTHTLFDVLAILAQLTALLIWSIVSGYWLIPIALILISFEWWENFVTTNSAISKNIFFLDDLHVLYSQFLSEWIRSLSELRKNLFMSRYDIYLYVAPLKIITFLGCAIAFTNVKLFDFFSKAFDGWDRRLIEIQEVHIFVFI